MEDPTSNVIQFRGDYLLGAVVASLFVPITGASLGGVGLGRWLAHRTEPGRLELALDVVPIGLAV